MNGVCVAHGSDHSRDCVIIRKKTTTRPMTAKEIAMLPRGTAFIFGKEVFYNPGIYVDGSGNVRVLGTRLLSYKGYRLPTDPDDSEPRPFTVEE